MKVTEFDLFRKEEDGYYSVLKILVNDEEYIVERLHDETIALAGWDGDIEKLKKLVGEEMRRQVMYAIECDAFADFWKGVTA